MRTGLPVGRIRKLLERFDPPLPIYTGPDWIGRPIDKRPQT